MGAGLGLKGREHRTGHRQSVSASAIPAVTPPTPSPHRRTPLLDSRPEEVWLVSGESGDSGFCVEERFPAERLSLASGWRPHPVPASSLTVRRPPHVDN